MGIWVKSIWEFFTKWQLLCESKFMKTLKVKRKKEKKRNVDLYRSASGMILAAKNGKQTPSDLNIESYLCFTDV